jgi:hypothetical protein
MTEGAETAPASAFKVLVLAPLRAAAEQATNEAWTKPVRFTAAEFDQQMMAVAPAIDIELTVGPKQQKTSHAFRAMRSFRPDVLMEQASVLRALRAGASNVPPPLSQPARPSMTPADIVPANVLDATLLGLVTHDTVRALERAWTGLHHIVEKAGENVTVDAMNAHAVDFPKVLEHASDYDLVVIDLPVAKPSVNAAVITSEGNGTVGRPRHKGPVRRTFGVVLDEPSDLVLGSAIGLAEKAVENVTQTGWALPLEGSPDLINALFRAHLARATAHVAEAMPASTPEAAARDIVKVALAADGVDLAVMIGGGKLVVTAKPNGFRGVTATEVKAEAPLGE